MKLELWVVEIQRHTVEGKNNRDQNGEVTNYNVDEEGFTRFTRRIRGGNNLKDVVRQQNEDKSYMKQGIMVNAQTDRSNLEGRGIMGSIEGRTTNRRGVG